MTHTRLLQLLAAVAILGIVSEASLHSDEKAKTKPTEEPPLVYELRTYTTHAGRLSALHARFRDHTVRLFEKHGIKNVAYWTPADKPDTLIYIVAHKSQEQAKKSWKEFVDDPEWQTAYKASHKDGPIVSKVETQFLAPTDYSPMK